MRCWSAAGLPATHGEVYAITGVRAILRETAEHHGSYEKTHAKHDWWDWYAPYLSAREHGGSPEVAAAAADRYMERVSPALPR